MVFGDQMSEYEKDLFHKYVKQHEYECYRNKTTVVVMVLKSGFEIVGTAGCADPNNFDENLGHMYALKDALRKLGEMDTFHKAQVKYMLERD